MPGLRSSDHRLTDLLSELSAIAPELFVSLVSVDWCDAACPPNLPPSVRLANPFENWDTWAADWSPELVVVCGPVAALRFWEVLSGCWAGVPVAVDTLALRSPDRAGLRGEYDPAGAAQVREVCSAIDLRLLRRAQLVLCRSRSDAQAAKALCASVPRIVLAGRVRTNTRQREFAGQHRLAVVGSFVEGIDSPDEDAAIFLAREVLPELRAQVNGAALDIIGEDLPPSVRTLDGDSVRVHWLHGRLRDALATADVVVAARRFGRVSTMPLVAAAEVGLPVVSVGFSSPLEAPLRVPARGRLVADAVAPLLSEEDLWSSAREAFASWVRDNADPERFRSRLASGLEEAGLLDGSIDMRTAVAEPEELSGRQKGRWVAISDRRGLNLHLPDVVQTSGLSSPLTRRPDVDDTSYDAWYRRRISTPARRAEWRAAIRTFAFRPRLSVVMPVFDTDPEILQLSIESVRSQIYEFWELCIADDGSTRISTLDMLAENAGLDRRIRVKHLDENRGIAAASNEALSVARGEFVVFLDHDDLLETQALFEVVQLLNEYPELDLIYSDEHRIDSSGRFVDPFLKPAYSPDLLLSTNYVCHLTAYRRSLVDSLGGLRGGYDGAQDFDLLLRAVERTGRIGHIAKPLYRWRYTPGSVSAEPLAKPEPYEAGRRAVSDAVFRRGRAATVTFGDLPGQYRVRYELGKHPHVAIVIPTKDHLSLLSTCVDSIREMTTYDRYELVIVDNGTTDPETLRYLAAFDGRVLRYPYRFHYARMMNLAATTISADQFLFLNNDIEVRTKDWLETMLEHGQHSEVGAVGTLLSYPSGSPAHEGVFVGLGTRGPAGNIPFGSLPTAGGEWHFISTSARFVRNFSAVTGACCLVRPSVFWEVGGFDERLHIAYNDIDLGLKLRHRGYEVVYTPYANLTHHEQASRRGLDPPENDDLFRARWGVTASYKDPYGNPNYDPDRWFLLRN
jgi:GT2 family glycosyltransferase